MEPLLLQVALLRISDARFISYRDIVKMVSSIFAIVVFLPDNGEH